MPRAGPADLARDVHERVPRIIRPEFLAQVDVQRLATLAAGMSAWLDPDQALERTLASYGTLADTLGWTTTAWETKARSTGDPTPSIDGNGRADPTGVVSFLRANPPEAGSPEIDYDANLDQLKAALESAGVSPDRYAESASLLASWRDEGFASLLDLYLQHQGSRQALETLETEKHSVWPRRPKTWPGSVTTYGFPRWRNSARPNARLRRACAWRTP